MNKQLRRSMVWVILFAGWIVAAGQAEGAWHTFYGSSENEWSVGIATDGSGNVYVTGWSNTTWNGPAWESPLHAHSGGWDIFVLKLLSRASRGCDFDGDGKADIAVYRDGAWFILPSGGGSPYAVGWGGDASDIPISINPASYM